MQKSQKIEGISLDTKMCKNTELIKVCRHAIEVFGSCEKADHWLSSPLPILGGMAPIAILLDEADGAERVDTILTRIEYGVFS